MNNNSAHFPDSSAKKPISELFDHKEYFSTDVIKEIMQRMNVGFRDPQKISDEHLKNIFNSKHKSLDEPVTLIIPNVIAFDKKTKIPYMFSRRDHTEDIVLLPLTMQEAETVYFPKIVSKKLESSLQFQTQAISQRMKQLVVHNQLRDNVSSHQKEEALLAQMKKFAHTYNHTEKTPEQLYQHILTSLPLSADSVELLTTRYTVDSWYEEAKYPQIAKILSSYIPHSVQYELLPFRVNTPQYDYSFIPVLVQHENSSLRTLQLLPEVHGKSFSINMIPFVEHSIFDEHAFPGEEMDMVRSVLKTTFSKKNHILHGAPHPLEQRIAETPERIWFLASKFNENQPTKFKNNDNRGKNVYYVLSYNPLKKEIYFVNSITGEETPYTLALIRFMKRFEQEAMPPKIDLKVVYTIVQKHLQLFSPAAKQSEDVLLPPGFVELEKHVENIKNKYALVDNDMEYFFTGSYYYMSGLRKPAHESFTNIQIMDKLTDLLSWEKDIAAGVPLEPCSVLRQGGLSSLHIRDLEHLTYVKIRDEAILPRTKIEKDILDFNKQHGTEYELFSSTVLCIHKEGKYPCVLVKDRTGNEALQLFPIQATVPSVERIMVPFESNYTEQHIAEDITFFLNAIKWFALFDKTIAVPYMGNISLPKDIVRVLQDAYTVRKELFVGVDNMSEEEFSAMVERFTLLDLMRFTNSRQLNDYLLMKQNAYKLSTLTINLTVNAANWGRNKRRMDFIEKLNKEYNLLDNVLLNKQGRTSDECKMVEQKEGNTVGKIFEPMVMFLLGEYLKKIFPNMDARIFASNNALNANGVDFFVCKKNDKTGREYVAVDLSVKQKTSQYFQGYSLYRDQTSKKLMVLGKDNRAINASYVGKVTEHKNLLLPLEDGLRIFSSIGSLLDRAMLLGVHHNKRTNKLEYEKDTEKEINVKHLDAAVGRALSHSSNITNPEEVFDEYIIKMYKRIIE